MSKQLYEEAIADLKKVKEIAEDNAKRAVVEAVAPRIRELIEKELLGESLEEEEKEEEMHSDEPTGDKEKLPLLKGAEDTDEAKEAVPFAKLAGDAGESSTSDALETRLHYVEQMLEKLVDKKDDSVMESIDSELSSLNDEIDEIYEHVQENVVDPAARLGYGLKLRNCLEKIEKLQETTMKKNLLGEEKVRIELDLPGVDLGEMEDAAVELVLDEEGEEEEAGEEEMEMEPEAGEEKPAEEEAPEAGEEPAAEEPSAEEEGLLEISDLSDDSVVEIDESMLRNEIALMKILREADESDNSEEGHAPAAKEFDDFGGAKEEGEALEMELSEAYGMDEDVYEMAKPGMEEYSMDEVDHDGMDLDEAELEEMMHKYMAETEASKTDDTTADPQTAAETVGTTADVAKKSSTASKTTEVDETLEIVHGDDNNEAVELDEMDNVSQAKDAGEYNTKHKNVQGRQPSNESVRAEMATELELQESLRKRASQLKKVYEAAKKVASGAKTLIERKEASSHTSEIKAQYAKTAEKYNASVARFNKLSQALSESAVKGTDSNSGAQSGASADQIDMLSKKLAETNLFNAKLLFTNKLLQTESLTARQKAQVIEQLDAAETIREAKLVYESLAKTMVKPRKTVTESRVLGSSSQATRPASTQTLSEGVESERWARLAGIK